METDFLKIISYSPSKHKFPPRRVNETDQDLDLTSPTHYILPNKKKTTTRPTRDLPELNQGVFKLCYEGDCVILNNQLYTSVVQTIVFECSIILPVNNQL